jgi:hypothetical protein
MDINKKYNKVRTTILSHPKRINSFVPNPTEDDYKKGYLTRFFIQKTNDVESPIYEVASSNFRKYTNNQSYKGVSLRWRIRGPLDMVFNDRNEVTDKGVRQSNKISVNIASEKIKNIKLYLPNVLQFYKK